VWPGRSGDPYSDHINTMRKLVFSSQVSDPAWENTIVVTEDPAETVRRIKAEEGGDIVQYGFGHLAHQLMATGLIDELRLWIHPLFIGHGGSDALLYRDAATTNLNLAATTALDNGIVIVTYTRP
jgi:dihydrofolate reductase